MCLPFFHKWKYELIQSIRVFTEASTSIPGFYQHLYLGTCLKCGTIKKKSIKTK